MAKTKPTFSTTPILKHSLATPVTNILTSIELAQNAQKKTSHQIYLRQALLNARYMKHVLQLADKPSDLDTFEVISALKEVLEMNNQMKSIVLSKNIPSSQILFGNKLIFQEMMVAILNNAFESYAAAVKNPVVKIVIQLQEDFLVLHVVDGGQGMTWVEKTRCCSKKFTTKKNHQGLGLHFVKSNIKTKFGGSLKITSQKQAGTTISLFFPLQTYAETRPTSIDN